jgi:hypothetical protein
MNNIKLIDCGYSQRILFKNKVIGIITPIAEHWQIQNEERVYKSAEEAIAILVARQQLKDFQGTKKAGSKGRIIR